MLSETANFYCSLGDEHLVGGFLYKCLLPWLPDTVTYIQDELLHGSKVCGMTIKAEARNSIRTHPPGNAKSFISHYRYCLTIICANGIVVEEEGKYGRHHIFQCLHLHHSQVYWRSG